MAGPIMDGEQRVWFVPSIENVDAPKLSELTAPILNVGDVLAEGVEERFKPFTLTYTVDVAIEPFARELDRIVCSMNAMMNSSSRARSAFLELFGIYSQHHRRETPARSAMHAAYHRRRRARGRRR